MNMVLGGNAGDSSAPLWEGRASWAWPIKEKTDQFDYIKLLQNSAEKTVNKMES